MAIRTSIQPGQLLRIGFIGVLSFGLGLWGLYDYAVKIPRAEALVAEHAALVATKDALEAKQLSGALTAEETTSLENTRRTLAERFIEAPVPPAAFDRAVQLWVYVVLCGLVGTPWAVWMYLSLKKRQFELTEDGTLVTPEGSCPLREVRDIDMSRWMDKSIAVVTLADGTTSLLDDYKYKNLHLIVGAVASMKYPELWTADARKVVPPAADAGGESGGSSAAPTEPTGKA
jgi:hypothetical protein